MSNSSNSKKTPFKRISEYFLGVPIFIKILGIGIGITVLFGTVAFHQIRVGMFETHYKVHGETAHSIAFSLAERLKNLIGSDDHTKIDSEISTTISAFPELRYILVLDADGNIVSHGITFPKEAPPDLLDQGENLCSSCHASLSPETVATDMIEVPPQMALPAATFRVYKRKGGLVLEVTVPIPGKYGGTVRLGIGDKIIAREMRSINHSLLWTLTLCLLVGLSSAFALSYIIVRPIHNLLQTTNRLRNSEFEARAKIYSSDEIGELAGSFNEMAKALEDYRQEVREKENARVSLIAKIVDAQEEERKSVARELHDQLGHSLSNALLTIDATCGGHPELSKEANELKSTLRGLIDEVQRLAWHARPSILDDYGIERALERYVEETGKRVPFTIDYQYVVPPDAERLPNQIEVTLYRIAQEAITNIVRHANPSQCSVILLHQQREVSLIVEDDGVGFDAAKVKAAGGAASLGLMGMDERAALVGGEFSVDARSGKGTTVRVIIPLKDKSDENTNSDS